MSALVSLGLPVFNGEMYLASALASILAQDHGDFELVIVDNASTDRTETISRDIAATDTRVQYFRNPTNVGAAANFNRAFASCHGQYFKWCAHDDLLSSNFLGEAVLALEADPGAVIAYPRLLGIDQYGDLTSHDERDLPAIASASSAKRFRLLLEAHGWDAAMFGLWRRDALARTSLHAPYYGSDCALLAEMALLGRFVRAPRATLYSRDHPARSVNLQSRERMTWQDPQNAGSNAFELSRRIRHLVEISYRHRDEAPMSSTLYHLTAWLSDPLLVARLLLEGVGFVSPSLRSKLRSVGLARLKGASERARV